jgi:hypothetical protein
MEIIRKVCILFADHRKDFVLDVSRFETTRRSRSSWSSEPRRAERIRAACSRCHPQDFLHFPGHGTYRAAFRQVKNCE